MESDQGYLTTGSGPPSDCHVRSTILTSKLPVSRWHEQIGDPTLADGMLDRLAHNAHHIETHGDSDGYRPSDGTYNTADFIWYIKRESCFRCHALRDSSLCKRAWRKEGAWVNSF